MQNTDSVELKLPGLFHYPPPPTRTGPASAPTISALSLQADRLLPLQFNVLWIRAAS